MNIDNLYNILTHEKESEKEKIEQELKLLAKSVQVRLKKQYPNLRIVFRGIQKGASAHNIPDSYLFDIWMEPLIIKQQPTTVTLLTPNEQSLTTKTKETLLTYIDSAIKLVENELKSEYPDLKIIYKDYSSMLDNSHFFQLIYPGLIPPSPTDGKPSTPIGLKIISRETLFKKAKAVLDMYKEYGEKWPKQRLSI